MILFVNNNKGILFLGEFLGGFIKITAITIRELISQITGANDDCDL